MTAGMSKRSDLNRRSLCCIVDTHFSAGVLKHVYASRPYPQLHTWEITLGGRMERSSPRLRVASIATLTERLRASWVRMRAMSSAYLNLRLCVCVCVCAYVCEHACVLLYVFVA